MAVLVWDGPHGRIVLELERRITVVGRDAAVSDLLLEDATVSRRHALVEVNGDLVKITDLGSTTGTRINGAALTAQMPSTVEPGDFVHFGQVVVTFHHTPPPAPVGSPAASASVTASVSPQAPTHTAVEKPASESRPPASRARPVTHATAHAPAHATAGTGDAARWKWVAIGIGGVLLLTVGVLVGVLVGRPGEPQGDGGSSSPGEAANDSVSGPGAAQDAAGDPSGGGGMAVTDPMGGGVSTPDTESGETTSTKPKPPKRAEVGSLPPAMFASVVEFPQLLEMKSGEFRPLNVTRWDRIVVEGTAPDGLLYEVGRAKLRAVFDRVALERSAAQSHAALRDGDVDAQVDLAQWCVARYLNREAKALLKEALSAQPGHARAKSLLSRLGDS